MLITISKKSLIFPPPPVRNKDIKYISLFLKNDWWMLTGKNAMKALVAKSAPAGLPHLVGHGAVARRRPHWDSNRIHHDQ